MGLLSRVVSQYIPELDEGEKVLRDRILRLAPKEISPYIALSLLKSYGSLHIGICLSLSKDQYIGYASVGLGIEKISIPLEVFPCRGAPGAARAYYKIESPELLPIKALDSQGQIWVFPLDPGEPPRFILLVVVLGTSKFNPQHMAWLLSDIREVLIYKQEAQGGLESAIPEQQGAVSPVKSQGKEPQELIIDKTAIAQEVQHTIIKYQKIHPSFQGILLEAPHQGERHSNTQISLAVSPFGSVIPLSATRSLVLFQSSLDRELIAHRLSKSLGLSPVLDFEADTPEVALALLSPDV